MKYLVLVLILSGCTKITGSNFEVSKDMYQVSDKICAQNGSIRSIELFKEDKIVKAYVACKNQGLIQIDQSGQVSTIKSRVDNSIQTELISEKDIADCKNKCQNKIKTIKVKPVTCECE